MSFSNKSEISLYKKSNKSVLNIVAYLTLSIMLGIYIHLGYSLGIVIYVIICIRYVIYVIICIRYYDIICSYSVGGASINGSCDHENGCYVIMCSCVYLIHPARTDITGMPVVHALL